MKPNSFLILFGSCLAAALTAAPDTPDPTFTSNAGSYYDQTDDGGVSSVLVQPDGKILVGSNEMALTGVNPQKQVSLVRFNQDGTVDTDFFSDTHPTGSDSGIFFDSAGWPEVHALGIQSNGKIIAAGVMQGVRIGTAAAPTTEFNSNSIVRFNPDGTIDTTFMTNGTALGGNLNYIEDVTIDAQDRILCAGGFGGFRNSSTQNYTTRYGLARLNADGSLDTTFQIDPYAFGVPAGTHSSLISGWFRRAITDASGKVYIAGELSWGNSFPKPTISVFARLFPDGTVDSTFIPAHTGVRDFVLEPDGKITAIGTLDSTHFFKRFNTNGTLDPAFNFPGGFTSLTARPLRRSASGQYLVVVNSANPQDKLIRVNANGSIDPTFDPVATHSVAGKIPYIGTWDIAPNGKIYSGSFFTAVEGTTTHKIVAFEGDYTAPSAGTINLSLGSATIIEQNGNFYAAVTRTSGDTGAVSVTLSTSNGSANAGSDYTSTNTTVSWAAGESGTKYVPIPILADATQEPNETFTVTLSSPTGATLGSSTSGNITILDSDTPPSITAHPQSQSTNAAQTVTFSVQITSALPVTYQWLKNGNPIAGATQRTYTTPALTPGDTSAQYTVTITSTSGSITSNIATLTVLTPDGTPDPMWTSAPTSYSGSETTVMPDGTSFAIDSPFGQPQTIKKFLPNGTHDTSYVSPAFTTAGNNANLFSISVAPDGKVYVYGSFDSVGGVARDQLARLNADGTLDTTFAPIVASNHTIGGNDIFATTNGLYLALKPLGQQGGLARLTNTGAIDPAFKFGSASTNNNFLSIRSLVELGDGKLLIGYLRGSGASVSSYGFTRLETDGDEDATFTAITNIANGLTHFPTGIAVRPDGSFFYATSRQLGLANSDGTINSSFTLSGAPNGTIHSITLAKGKLIAVGAFTEIAGTAVGRIARINPNGYLDITFPGGQGADDEIFRVTTLSNGKLHLGGIFNTFNTASYPSMVTLLMSDPAIEILPTSSVFENAGSVDVTLRRTGRTDVAISVDLSTASGSATQNTDYTGANTTVSWTTGDPTDKTVTITLLDDGTAEGTEDFTVNLSNPTDAALINSSTTVTIRDDEAVPTISMQPLSSSVLENGSATFSVTASSGLPLSYQWYFNNTIIPIATSSSYTVNPVTAAEEGDYHVIISTAFESITSDTANLAIVPDPTLVSSLFTNPASSPASGEINIVVAAPDGGAYIGGSFLDFGGNSALDYIAKIDEDGSIDTSFNPPTLNNQVYDIAVAPNGDIYLAGRFTGTVMKLAADGTEDTSFSSNRGTGGNERANAIGIFPDGTIAVAGDFDSWNGTTIAAFNLQNSHLVRLNADGTLTTTRYPNPGNNSHYILDIDAMRVFPDGRVMVAYNQSSSIYAKARLYNTDGTEVTSFAYPFNSKRVFHIDQFPDGSFLFSGDNSLYKVSQTGSITTTYNTASDWVSSAIQIDGKIISALTFGSPQISRYLTTQQSDPIFSVGTKFTGNVNSLSLRDDGRLWAAGNFTQYDGTAYPGVVLLENQPISLAIIGQPQNVIQDPGTTASFTCEATGTTAISYQWRKNGSPLTNGGDISGATSMTLNIANIEDADEGDYTCVVTNTTGSETSDIALLTVLGAPEVVSLSPDTTVLAGNNAEFVVDAIGAGSLSYQWQKGGVDLPGETSATLTFSSITSADAGDYRVVITNTIGSITSDAITLTVSPNAAAPHPDFTALTAVGGAIETILILPNGNVLVGGSFLSLSDGTNTSGARLALVSPTGIILSGSSLNADSTVYKLRLQADGKILVAGNFNNVNGVSRPRAARLNSDLTIDNGFTPPTTTVFGTARDIAEDSNNDVVVSGEFSSWNNLADTAYMVRFSSNGTHDTTFKSSANNRVTSIIPQSNGSYVIAGWFTDYGSNASADAITRINSDGNLDTTVLFNPGFFFAEEVYQSGTGHLILLNDFQNPIKKYDAAGTEDTSFWTNFNANGGTRAVAENASGKYLIGGRFTNAGGNSVSRLTRLNPDGTSDLTGFDVGTGFDNDVKDIQVAADGSIWVGGLFSTYNGNSAASLVRLTGTPTATPFQQWAAANGLVGNDAAFNGDPDKDGTINAIEFLYNTDPNTPQSPPNWNPTNSSDSGANINSILPSAGLDPTKTYRVIEIRTPLDLKGLTVTAQSSTTLTGFNTNNIHPLGAATTTATHSIQKYYLTPATEDAPLHFWRIQLTP